MNFAQYITEAKEPKPLVFNIRGKDYDLDKVVADLSKAVSLNFKEIPNIVTSKEHATADPLTYMSALHQIRGSYDTRSDKPDWYSDLVKIDNAIRKVMDYDYMMEALWKVKAKIKDRKLENLVRSYHFR